MSWAEVKKINSDLQEPLNYDHYITDISIFGAQSFIMSPENADLWDEMALKSRRLYSHRAIHDYVYERLTDKNIDTIYQQSGVLGNQLNAFHLSDLYSGNTASDLLKCITQRSYKALLEKFQQGYRRHVERILSSSIDIGKWLNTTFDLGISELENKATWDDILNDNEAVKMLFQHENAMLAITTNNNSMNALAAHPTALDVIIKEITFLAESEELWQSTLGLPDLMKAIFDNPVSFQVIANSGTAMKAILQSATAMSELFKSEESMKVLISSATAMNAITQATTDVVNAAVSPENIQESNRIIISSLPNVVGDLSIMESMVQAQQVVQNSLLNLSPVIASAVTNQETIKYFYSNEDIMKAVTFSSIAMQTIAANEAAMEEILGNTIAANLTIKSPVAMQNIALSEIAMNVISRATNLFNTISNNAIAMNAILKSPWRSYLFSIADFRNKINKNFSLFENKTYFTSEQKTSSVVACSSAYALTGLITLAPEGSIYKCFKTTATDTYPTDAGGTNAIDIYDYDIPTVIQSNLSVSASGKSSTEYGIINFMSIHPKFKVITSSGSYAGEVGLSTSYTLYTAI